MEKRRKIKIEQEMKEMNKSIVNWLLFLFGAIAIGIIIAGVIKFALAIIGITDERIVSSVGGLTIGVIWYKIVNFLRNRRKD